MLNNHMVIQPYLPSEVVFFSLKHVKLPVKLPESNHFFVHQDQSATWPAPPSRKLPTIISANQATPSPL